MKILIADDEVKRYGRLIEALQKVGVSREEIDLVPSAIDARDRMTESRYDFLILDILLSLRPETDPDIRHSLDLLTELQEGDLYQKPRRILGITGDRTAAGAAEQAFSSYTWTVIEYSASSDEWINKCVNCVRYQNEIDQTPESVASYGVDLVIICALEKPELEEILKLDWHWSSPRPISDVVFVHDGYVYVNDVRISVCATAAPRMGMVSTALHAAAAISLLRPRLIVMCGICAGVQQKTRLGDVLFADPAWDYQSGKRVRDKGNATFSFAPQQLPAPMRVRTHVEQIRADQQALSKLATDFGSDGPGSTRVLIGPMASGSAVLADGEVVTEIKQQHRELIGIEMEVYGLYAAAHTATTPQPLAFALKGVCDFADSDKGDAYQRYAAYASANVLKLLIERFGPRLLAKA